MNVISENGKKNDTGDEKENYDAEKLQYKKQEMMQLNAKHWFPWWRFAVATVS